MRLFDAHCHIGKWGSIYYNGKSISPFPKEYDSYDNFRLNYLSKYNPNFAVIVPQYLPDIKSTFSLNNLVMEFINIDPRLIGGLWINPSREVENLSLDTLSMIPCKRIKVIKMSPDAWISMTPDPSSWNETAKRIIEKCIDLSLTENLIMQFHTGSKNSDMIHYEKFLEEFGNTGVRIQFVHMGNTASGHFKFIPLFSEWLNRKYNVYCDISWSRGFGPRWLVHNLTQNGHGLDRVLFASDEPWWDFLSEAAKVHNLDITDDDKLNIFYNNAYKLYRPEV